MNEKQDEKIIIYSADWCAFCKTEKQYLDKLGYAYTEKNVEQDKDAYEELMAKINGDFRGVPVTDIDGEIILGFDRRKIDDTLKTKALAPTA